MWRFWLVLGGIGSVWGSNGSLWGSAVQYLVILGHYGRYWLVIGGTWSVWSVTGWFLLVLGQYRARAVLDGT